MGFRLGAMMKLALCSYLVCMMLLTAAEAFPGLMPPQQSLQICTTSTTTTSPTTTTTTTTALNAGGFLRRFRKGNKAATIEQARQEIGVGASLPEVDVEVLNTDDDGKVYTEIKTVVELLAGTNKAIVLGMPGAFTPTCTGEHLPGFIDNSSRLGNLGVGKIIVLTTNDRYVNEQWGKQFKVLGDKLFKFVSDGDGDFVRSLGLAADMGFGVGIRSKRFALVVENGKVTNVQVDEGMDNCSMTSAKSVIQMITPDAVEESESDTGSLVVVGGAALVAGVLAFLLSGGFGDGGGTANVPKSAAPIDRVVNSKQSRFSLLDEYNK